MKMEDFHLTRAFFLLSSLVILAVGVTKPQSDMNTMIIGVLSIVVLLVLDIKIPSITKLKEDNEKVKSMRLVNRISMLIIIVSVLSTMLLPMYTIFSIRIDTILHSGLLSIFMVMLGKVSPYIPFNRYLGLRLPWTIRDEETWDVAHNVVGYISFPIAISQLALNLLFDSERIIPVAVLVWILIPSLYSLWFCYRKYA